MRKKQTNRTICFRVTDEFYEDLEGLKQTERLNSVSEVVRFAVRFYYNKVNPSYVARRATSETQTPLTIQQIAKRKVAMKEAEQNAKIEAQYEAKRPICEDLLNGKVVDDPNGRKYCEYFFHTTVGSQKQRLPLLAVTNELSLNLFAPTEAIVMKARPNLDVRTGKDKEEKKK